MLVDSGQLEQVVINLAANARDAMPTGGMLTLETRVCELDVEAAAQRGLRAHGAYVELSVSDTGVGMDNAIQARAFEPFFTTKPLGHGMGMGLATIHGIVTESGGHVSVRSQRGTGTTFIVLLPVSVARTAETS